MEKRLGDLARVGLPGGEHGIGGSLDVVLGAHELHTGSEQSPVGAGTALVRPADCADVYVAPRADQAVELNMRVAPDHDGLLDALELGGEVRFGGDPGQDALVVLRDGVTAADRTETVDLDRERERPR